MIINESTLYRTQGKRADTLFYQMREEGEERWVFVCNTDRKESTPVEVGFKGEWKIEVSKSSSLCRMVTKIRGYRSSLIQ